MRAAWGEQRKGKEEQSQTANGTQQEGSACGVRRRRRCENVGGRAFTGGRGWWSLMKD